MKEASASDRAKENDEKEEKRRRRERKRKQPEACIFRNRATLERPKAAYYENQKREGE